MWILFYALLSAAGTVNTGTAEFNDKAACEAAVDAVADTWGKSAHAFCTPKGTEDQDATPARPAGSGSTAKAPTARK